MNSRRFKEFQLFRRNEVKKKADIQSFYWMSAHSKSLEVHQEYFKKQVSEVI